MERQKTHTKIHLLRRCLAVPLLCLFLFLPIASAEHTHFYEASYRWSEDLSSCTATLTCTCGDTAVLPMTVQYETYEAAGIRIYYAEVIYNNVRFLTDREEPIPPQTHTHAYTEIIAFPQGHTLRCSCGAETEAYSHTMAAWETITLPTAKTDGRRMRACTVCGYAEYAWIPATGEDTHVDAGEETPVLWNNPYTDVSQADAFYEAVRYVTGKKLFLGTGDGSTFSPHMTMSRAMFVTVMARLGAVTPDRSLIPVFVDVDPENQSQAWYAPYVGWGDEAGIVLGDGAGYFFPEDSVTVEQAALILMRYARNIARVYVPPKGELPYTYDGDTASEWARSALIWAYENEIYRGEDGFLHPTEPASRAVVAEMLYHFVVRFGLM